MSGTNYNISPPPAVFPSMRAGEGDWRILDCTPDLGPIQDTISAVGTITLSIARQDGAPMTENDLQLGGTSWPNTLDSTGLMPSFGSDAPAGAAGSTYVVTVTIYPTTSGRRFIRDVYLTVLALMG